MFGQRPLPPLILEGELITPIVKGEEWGAGYPDCDFRGELVAPIVARRRDYKS